MVTAITLIQAERGDIPKIATQVANTPHVAEVYSVAGEWDIVAIIRMPRYEVLDDVVTQHLRNISGIVRTQTMLAFRTYSQDLLDRSFNLGLDEEKI